jgi:hypothetical protein
LIPSFPGGPAGPGVAALDIAVSMLNEKGEPSGFVPLPNPRWKFAGFMAAKAHLSGVPSVD